MASNNESTPSTMSTTQAVSNDTETISNTAAGNTTKKGPSIGQNHYAGTPHPYQTVCPLSLTHPIKMP